MRFVDIESIALESQRLHPHARKYSGTPRLYSGFCIQMYYYLFVSCMNTNCYLASQKASYVTVEIHIVFVDCFYDCRLQESTRQTSFYQTEILRVGVHD